MQMLDLVVHIDEDGDPILEANTQAGRDYIHQMNPEINDETPVIITSSPEEFVTAMPRTLTLGVTNPYTGRTQKLCPPPLH